MIGLASIPCPEPTCARGFASERARDEHVREHHPTRGKGETMQRLAKPEKCTEPGCDFSSDWPPAVGKHRASHERERGERPKTKPRGSRGGAGAEPRKRTARAPRRPRPAANGHEERVTLELNRADVTFLLEILGDVTLEEPSKWSDSDRHRVELFLRIRATT